MKTKPVLITIGMAMLIAVVILFIRGHNPLKPQKSEVKNFLVLFENQLKFGNTDSALNYFDVNQKRKTLVRLVNILANKSGLKDKTTPLFSLTLDIDNSDIKVRNAELAEATIPVFFSHKVVVQGASSIKFRIRKEADHNYKIVQVEATKLIKDYVEYENLVISKTDNFKYIYSDITLASFKTAEKLKNKYDSVLYFEHIGNKTTITLRKESSKDMTQTGINLILTLIK